MFKCISPCPVRVWEISNHMHFSMLVTTGSGAFVTTAGRILYPPYVEMFSAGSAFSYTWKSRVQLESTPVLHAGRHFHHVQHYTHTSMASPHLARIQRRVGKVRVTLVTSYCTYVLLTVLHSSLLSCCAYAEVRAAEEQYFSKYNRGGRRELSWGVFDVQLVMYSMYVNNMCVNIVIFGCIGLTWCWYVNARE